MMYQEAHWLGERLAAQPVDRLSPMLSIGSGNARFRNRRQPWIGALVYDPLEARGVKVLHHELRAGEGVDIDGDLTDPDFIDRLRLLGVRSVLCCNVLEHLSIRDPFVDALRRLVDDQRLLFVTVPRQFAFHPDPIDTMYRPDPPQLCRDLGRLTNLECEVVVTDSLVRYWLRTPTKAASLRNGLRVTLGRRDRGRSLVSPPRTTRYGLRDRVRQSFVATAVTCGLFEGVPRTS